MRWSFKPIILYTVSREVVSSRVIKCVREWLVVARGDDEAAARGDDGVRKSASQWGVFSLCKNGQEGVLKLV